MMRQRRVSDLRDGARRGGCALALSVGLAGLAACDGAPATDGPIVLRFAESIAPTSYVVEYEQDIEWGEGRVERRYGADYTLGVHGPQGTARLEELRVTMSTPHGRQTLDARHLSGTEFELTLGPSGGRPAYPDNAPVLQMPGMLEGEVAASRLLDFGFPALPQDAVEVGDGWTQESTWPQVEAHVTATADATTEYRLAGWETVDGIECARIEGLIVAEVHAPPYDLHGATVELNGTLEGTLTWLFDPVGGVLVRMTGETSSDGVLTAAGNDTRIRQHTRVRIDPRVGS